MEKKYNFNKQRLSVHFAELVSIAERENDTYNSYAFLKPFKIN